MIAGIDARELSGKLTAVAIGRADNDELLAHCVRSMP
jgi:hypothetical protein